MKTHFHLKAGIEINPVVSSTLWQRCGARGEYLPLLKPLSLSPTEKAVLAFCYSGGCGWTDVHTQAASGFHQPADFPSFRTRHAVRMDVVEKKASVSEIAVACGAERGVFELSKFGPGGASRCIRFASKCFFSCFASKACSLINNKLLDVHFPFF